MSKERAVPFLGHVQELLSAELKPKDTFLQGHMEVEDGPAVWPSARLCQEMEDKETQGRGGSPHLANTPPLPILKEVVQCHIFPANQEQGGS